MAQSSVPCSVAAHLRRINESNAEEQKRTTARQRRAVARTVHDRETPSPLLRGSTQKKRRSNQQAHRYAHLRAHSPRRASRRGALPSARRAHSTLYTAHIYTKPCRWAVDVPQQPLRGRDKRDTHQRGGTTVMPSGSFYASSKGERKREREMKAARAQGGTCMYTHTWPSRPTTVHTKLLHRQLPPSAAVRCHLSGKVISGVEGRLGEIQAEVSL